MRKSLFCRVEKIVLFLLLVLAPSAPLRAEEPSGCDKFKWPIAREQAALAAQDKTRLAADSVLAAGAAASVPLAEVEQTHFVQQPQRAPAPGTFAAVLKLPAPPAGVYTVSLSAGAWIDVIQDGVLVAPLDFSGAKNCPNIRKSLKYRLSAQDTAIQISNAAAPEIALVILAQ